MLVGIGNAVITTAAVDVDAAITGGAGGRHGGAGVQVRRRLVVRLRFHIALATTARNASCHPTLRHDRCAKERHEHLNERVWIAMECTVCCLFFLHHGPVQLACNDEIHVRQFMRVRASEHQLQERMGGATLAF